MTATSSSAIINRSLKAHVAPALKAAGFEAVDARNGWAWKGPCIWVFNIRAVGAYFSGVTGWPPSSVSVWMGTYYTFIAPQAKMKKDGAGRLRPTEVQCDRRSRLERGIAGNPRSNFDNPREQVRRDIWWLEPDGSNAEEAARDIAEAVSGPGMAWYLRGSDLARTFEEVETQDDCFNKFVLARHLARHLNRDDAVAKYAELAEAEGRRIGMKLDPESWYPLHASHFFPLSPRGP